MINLLKNHWLQRLEQYTHLIVGFSGGLDSTVLLHLLASSPLKNKLIAVHVNHGISANAWSWQNHTEQFCAEREIPFIARSVLINKDANLEEEARNARYAVFAALMNSNDCLLLGHHLDDQAETVLLQLFRGTGVDGLAAMPEWGRFGAGYLARPFLSCSRKHVEDYACEHQLSWIEDESNQDTYYARNYVRHQIIPLLSKQWPGVIGNIARTANHCQQARTNLDTLAFLDIERLITKEGALLLAPLKELNEERISNVLRFWLKNNAISLPSTLTFQRLIHEVLLARSDAMPVVSWGEVEIRRYQDCLYLSNKKGPIIPFMVEWTQFPSPVTLVENSLNVKAQTVTQGISIPKGSKITLCSRKGGEVFVWHGQSKQLKKLFQEWSVPPWLREGIPLLYVNDQLAAVVGYAVSDLFFKSDGDAWKLSVENISL